MRGAALVACVALTACGGGFGGGGSTNASQSGLSNLFGARPASEVTVTQNRVRIAGPEGYCVDPTGTQDSPATGFVLLGNCAAIPRSLRSQQPANPAILTASVGDNPGDPVATRLAEMDSYLRSAQGRSALSRSGDADTVVVLDSFAQNDILYIRARDTSVADDPDVSSDYWRAIFDTSNALVTLSVIGTRSNQLPPQTGLQTLEGFTQVVRELNGTASSPSPVARFEPEPANEPPASQAPIWGGLGEVGFLRRLLG